MLGENFGSYCTVEKLGEGGMGVVYSARHLGLDRLAVVKVLHRHLCDSEEMARRFINEARATAGIRHPGIVDVEDVGRHPSGQLYIIMEYLDGQNLAERLADVGRLPWQTAVGFAQQATRALSAVHKNDIVHRDLKPENMFLVPDPDVAGKERVKLLDFGIAKLLEGKADSVTVSGTLLGSPPYMSPEQCYGKSDIDHRTDLYAMGVILFEMLCGRRPFVKEGHGEYIIAHVSEAPPPVAALAPDVPPVLGEICAYLLAKNREHRYQSAAALLEALDAVLASHATPATGSIAAGVHTGGFATGAHTGGFAAGVHTGGFAAGAHTGGFTTGAPMTASPYAPTGVGIAPPTYSGQVAHAAMTPTPGAMTPTPGAMTPTPGAMTPTPGAMTPMPGSVTPPPGGMTMPPTSMAGSQRESRRGLVFLLASIAIAGALVGAGVWIATRSGGAANSAVAQPTDDMIAPDANPLPAIPEPEIAHVALKDTAPMPFIAVPAQTFTMGSPGRDPNYNDDEGPRHKVSLAAFHIAVHEVTQKQWQTVMGSQPSDCAAGCGDDLPVQNVSWRAAIEFANRLSARESLTPCYEVQTEGEGKRATEVVTWKPACDGYRLPSEAEWEMAARAGTDTAYSFGDEPSGLDAHAWHGGKAGNGGKQVHPVGTRRANPWGLRDVHGNVWEWVWDRYGDYPRGPQTDPRGPDAGDERVLRGGCHLSSVQELRSPYRIKLPPDESFEYLGLRLARSPAQ